MPVLNHANVCARLGGETSELERYDSSSVMSWEKTNFL